MKIRWLAGGVEDLKAVRAFVAQENLQAAHEIALKIRRSVAILSEFPALGRGGRVTGTRELVIAGTSYIVPYRIRGARIEVLRVIHDARKWPTRF